MKMPEPGLIPKNRALAESIDLTRRVQNRGSPGWTLAPFPDCSCGNPERLL
jgi:hypothetical protein